VSLGGQWADHESARDFVVPEAGGEQSRDLALALGELCQRVRRVSLVAAGGELGDEALRDARCEQRVAGDDDLDRAQQFVRPVSLSTKPLAPARRAP
jgi:hypothetical protein